MMPTELYWVCSLGMADDPAGGELVRSGGISITSYASQNARMCVDTKAIELKVSS